MRAFNIWKKKSRVSRRCSLALRVCWQFPGLRRTSMRWLSQLFSRSRRYDDLSASIREHIEERTEELIDEGIPPVQARQTARREFGNATLMEQRGREVWQWQRLESLLVDLKHVCRRLRRSPGFAITVVLTLGIGIGATTTVFSVINI